jgi:hypothetical protein
MLKNLKNLFKAKEEPANNFAFEADKKKNLKEKHSRARKGDFEILNHDEKIASLTQALENVKLAGSYASEAKKDGYDQAPVDHETKKDARLFFEKAVLFVYQHVCEGGVEGARYQKKLCEIGSRLADKDLSALEKDTGKKVRELSTYISQHEEDSEHNLGLLRGVGLETNEISEKTITTLAEKLRLERAGKEKERSELLAEAKGKIDSYRQPAEKKKELLGQLIREYTASLEKIKAYEATQAESIKSFQALVSGYKGRLTKVHADNKAKLTEQLTTLQSKAVELKKVSGQIEGRLKLLAGDERGVQLFLDRLNNFGKTQKELTSLTEPDELEAYSAPAAVVEAPREIKKARTIALAPKATTAAEPVVIVPAVETVVAPEPAIVETVTNKIAFPAKAEEIVGAILKNDASLLSKETELERLLSAKGGSVLTQVETEAELITYFKASGLAPIRSAAKARALVNSIKE